MVCLHFVNDEDYSTTRYFLLISMRHKGKLITKSIFAFV